MLALGRVQHDIAVQVRYDYWPLASVGFDMHFVALAGTLDAAAPPPEFWEFIGTFIRGLEFAALVDWVTGHWMFTLGGLVMVGWMFTALSKR